MIQNYHAHIYFDAKEEMLARDLRKEVASKFSAAVVGNLHLQAVGPHPKAMFQVLFPSDLFDSFIPWLQSARKHLDVLIHAESGNDIEDHTQLAMWLGSSLPLDLSRL
ncbi:MAG: DOPA 4,5-dioxygenase family protein [Pseudomonadales bacterium]|nr:DOPA 4,5-dioxygenase family protein [Pseudomonadales bacterium]